jgi:hypothetical protein
MFLIARAMADWNQALELCETLRLVLEPTKASKMRGGYSSGKRINMRAVIPYIASGFKKDKIWLRRTQVLILLALRYSLGVMVCRSYGGVSVTARQAKLPDHHSHR